MIPHSHDTKVPANEYIPDTQIKQLDRERLILLFIGFKYLSLTKLQLNMRATRVTN